MKDAVYCLPWEYMNVMNRRIVLLFLYKVQTPIALKAGGLVPVGVQTMAAVSHVPHLNFRIRSTHAFHLYYTLEFV